MRTSLALFAATLACVSGAAGQPPPGTDLVGIYTRTVWPAYSKYEGVGPQITVYIIFSGVSRPGLGGWALTLDQSGTGVIFLSATLSGQGAINLEAPPRFQVELPAPLTEAGEYGTFAVASLLYFYMSPDPTFLYLAGDPEGSGGGLPVYASAADAQDLVIAMPWSGAGSPVFAFNADPPCCDPVTSQTWGDIKGMFR